MDRDPFVDITAALHVKRRDRLQQALNDTHSLAHHLPPEEVLAVLQAQLAAQGLTERPTPKRLRKWARHISTGKPVVLQPYR